MMAFPWNFCNSFGWPGTTKWLYWSKVIYDYGFEGVFLPAFHNTNLCASRLRVQRWALRRKSTTIHQPNSIMMEQ